jgi:hypothetical protein
MTNKQKAFLTHTLFLIIAVFLTFFWTNSPSLSGYTVQLAALFILLYFLNQFFSKKQKTPLKLKKIIDGLIFTIVVLLLVGSTGSLSSPLFFLVYFLMFGLALLLGPTATFSLGLAIILLFSLTSQKTEPLPEMIQLLSLLLVTPLASFFSSQYLKSLEAENKITILKKEADVLENQIQDQETDILLWASLELKQNLIVVLNEANDLLSDISHLTFKQKEKLGKIRQSASKLLITGQRLKEEVDKATD